MGHKRSGKRQRQQAPVDAPSLAPELVVERYGLRAEVYKIVFRAGFWTRLAMLRARLWGRLGVHARAARATREVIPAIARSPWLGVWVGQMLARHGGREEACAVYWELQKLPPGHVEAYATLGRYLLSVGRPARAVEFLSEAVRLRPLDLELEHDYREALSVAASGSLAAVT